MKHISFVKVVFLYCLVISTGRQMALRETMVAAEATGSPDPTKTRTEIQALVTEFGTASTHNDLDALMEYYADGVISLSSDKSMMVGKAAIGDCCQKNIMGGKQAYVFQSIDVFARGNLIVDTGKYMNTDAAGNVGAGNSIELYEKQNDHYVGIREAYNNE